MTRGGNERDDVAMLCFVVDTVVVVLITDEHQKEKLADRSSGT